MALSKFGKAMFERGYEVRSFAKHFGISKSQMYKIINGEVEPKVKLAIELAKVFDKTVYDFWG